MARDSSRFVLKGDPVDDVLRDERENLADKLSAALAQLSDLDQESVRGILYRIPIPNGKYEWIREIYPAQPPSEPFDLNAIRQAMKDEYGGGDFCLTVMAGSKPATKLLFSVARDRVDPNAKKDEAANMNMFQIMLAQQADARRESQAQADRQMQMMQQANQQTMQMFAAMQASSTAMMTAMLGNREKVTDYLPLLQQQPQGGSIKEAVETLVLLKGILPGGEPAGGGFDADDIVGSVVRMGGPVLAAVGRAVQSRQGAQAETAYAAPEPSGPLTLPGAPPMPQIAAPTLPALDPADPLSRLLQLVREDVLFMFARNYDPVLAAEGVYSRIEAHGMAEAIINDAVAAFLGSADWLADLAARGVELRGNPTWANEFLQALISIHTEAAAPGGGDDHSAGGSGRTPDA